MMRMIYLALLPLLLGACSREEPPPAKVVRPAMTVVIGATGAAKSHLYSGEVRARYETVLAFRLGGKLTARNAEVGDRVGRGDVLARLDAADSRLQENATGAQYRQARDELQRYRDLYDKGFVSRSALDARETAFEAAAAQAGLAGNQLAYTTLTADHAGVITATLAEAGQVVAAGQPVFRLAREGAREVVIAVPESRLASVKPGMPAVIETGTGDGSVHTVAGRVREVAPLADAASRTYTVRVAFDSAAAAPALGMTARVRIGNGRQGTAGRAATYRVPLTAIFQQGEQSAVWVVGADNRVSLRPVEVAAYRDDGAWVAGGLAKGERIISAGVHMLASGEQIEPVAPDETR